MQQPERRPKKSNGFSWVGIIIFLLFAVGPRVLPLIQNLLAGTSLALPANIPVPLIIIAVIVAAVVANSAWRIVRAAQRGSEMRPPPTVTPPTVQTQIPPMRRMQAPMPPFGGPGVPFPVAMPQQTDTVAPQSLPTRLSPERVPSAPRFEPVITGKAVAASLGITALCGLVVLLASLIA